MMVHACHPKERIMQVLGHPDLHTEFQARHCYAVRYAPPPKKPVFSVFLYSPIIIHPFAFSNFKIFSTLDSKLIFWL